MIKTALSIILRLIIAAAAIRAACWWVVYLERFGGLL